MTAIFIPTSWFEPLPDWLEPWVLAGSIAVFLATVVWAIRQRSRESAQPAAGHPADPRRE